MQIPCVRNAACPKGMFTPRTMKSSQGLLKFVIGCWTRLGITSVYTKEKIVRVTMKFEVPKRHIAGLTLFTDMVQRILRWEKQKRCSSRKRKEKGKALMIEMCCYNDFLMIFFFGGGGKRRWRQENGQTWIFLKTTRFGHILKEKISTFIIWYTVTLPLGPHWVYT